MTSRPEHTAPSIHWREQPAPDEAQRHAEQAQRLVQIQRERSARQGTGRALHRKQIAAAQGTLEVLDGVPAFARYGLFAQPHDYEVRLRLSNGGMDRAADRVPDIRGFAFKVLGVQGESALGGPARSQDFSLINQSRFAFPGSAEFIDFVAAAARGQGALLRYLLRRYGLLGGPARLLGLIRSVSRPFGGFATEPLYSAVPIACGPYAVRVRLMPAPTNGMASPDARADWGADFARRLAAQALHWDLQLQPFTDEAHTPIEDASVDWPSPYTTVAHLMLPAQDLASPENQALAEQAEQAVFDPWQALAEHRPLGEVQRARKVAYYASQQARGAV